MHFIKIKPFENFKLVAATINIDNFRQFDSSILQTKLYIYNNPTGKQSIQQSKSLWSVLLIAPDLK